MDLPATSAECFLLILVAFADHINTTDYAATDSGLSVWAAIVHLVSTYNPIPVKHFAKPLTIHTGLRNGRIRPWEGPRTRRESVPKRGCEKESLT